MGQGGVKSKRSLDAVADAPLLGMTERGDAPLLGMTGGGITDDGEERGGVGEIPRLCGLTAAALGMT